MPPKPIASAGCDTTLFLCKKLTFQIKIYTQTRVSGSISLKFSPGNIDQMPHKPQQLTTGLHYQCFIGKHNINQNAPKFIYLKKNFEGIFPTTPTERSVQ